MRFSVIVMLVDNRMTLCCKCVALRVEDKRLISITTKMLNHHTEPYSNLCAVPFGKISVDGYMNPFECA